MTTINPGALGPASLDPVSAGRDGIASAERRSAYAVGALVLLMTALASGLYSLLSLTFADTGLARAFAGFLLFLTFAALTWAILLAGSAVTGWTIRARMRASGSGIWTAHLMYVLLGVAFAVALGLMKAGEGALATIG